MGPGREFDGVETYVEVLAGMDLDFEDNTYRLGVHTACFKGRLKEQI